jgi:hypothetical protein
MEGSQIMTYTNNIFLTLLDRELRNASTQWAWFAATRSAEAWCAFSAAHRRVHIVAVSLGIEFPIGKPVLRVKAETVTNKRAA